MAAAAAGRARQSVVSSPCAAPSRLPARSISRVSVSETLLVKRSVVPLKQGGASNFMSGHDTDAQHPEKMLSEVYCISSLWRTAGALSDNYA